MPPIKKKIFDTTQVDRSKPHEQESKVVRNGVENEENSQITTARRIDDDTSKNAQSQPINGAVSNINQEEDQEMIDNQEANQEEEEVDEGGEDEIDEDHLSHRMGRSFTDEAAATDPFKEPEPSQASRIEKIVAELAKTDRVTRLSMRTLRGQAASEVRAAGLTDI